MANVKQYSRARNGGAKLSGNFTVREFACKDGSDTILIDLDLMNILQQIRNHFGAAVSITSAYRTVAYNAQKGGAKSSYHIKGQAVDITVAGKTTAQIAAYAERLGVKGIIQYVTSNFVHIDTRPGRYWAKVVGSHTTAVSTFGGGVNYPSIRSGSRGDSVRTLQNALNAKGYSCGTPDGVFGARTTAAVKSFQRAKGLTADGVVGAKTWAALLG